MQNETNPNCGAGMFHQDGVVIISTFITNVTVSVGIGRAVSVLSVSDII